MSQKTSLSDTLRRQHVEVCEIWRVELMDTKVGQRHFGGLGEAV